MPGLEPTTRDIDNQTVVLGLGILLRLNRGRRGQRVCGDRDPTYRGRPCEREPGGYRGHVVGRNGSSPGLEIQDYMGINDVVVIVVVVVVV